MNKTARAVLTGWLLALPSIATAAPIVVHDTFSAGAVGSYSVFVAQFTAVAAAYATASAYVATLGPGGVPFLIPLGSAAATAGMLAATLGLVRQDGVRWPTLLQHEPAEWGLLDG